MMAHNYSQFFGSFYKLVVGNAIEITTSYGVYTYTIYNMKVVNESDTSELPIQSSQEILMVYTCYPFGNTSYTTQRYVVYAN